MQPEGLPAALRAFVAQEPDVVGDMRGNPLPPSSSSLSDDSDAAKHAPVRVPLAVVTFGSMMGVGDELLTDVIACLRERNFQVLVLTGWKGLPKTSSAAAATASSSAAEYSSSSASSGPGGRRRGNSPSRTASSSSSPASSDSSGASTRGKTPDPATATTVVDVPFSNDKRVLYWPEAPHGWLFSHAALVIHHGGAGTTGRALASGVPSLIIPVLRWSDQPHWGHLVAHKGVGVYINHPKPGKAHLRRALGALTAGGFDVAPFTGSRIGDAANSLGALVRAQPASAIALAAIESCLCNRVLPPAQADAIHPFAFGPSAASDPARLAALTVEQRMCVRCCVPCARVRRAMAAAASSEAGAAAGGRGQWRKGA